MHVIMSRIRLNNVSCIVGHTHNIVSCLDCCLLRPSYNHLLTGYVLSHQELCASGFGVYSVPSCLSSTIIYLSTIFLRTSINSFTLYTTKVPMLPKANWIINELATPIAVFPVWSHACWVTGGSRDPYDALSAPVTRGCVLWEELYL